MSSFNIPEGIVCREKFRVGKEHGAGVLGCRDVDVLSTPSMILFMEHTAWKCVEKYLPSDYTTVGTKICVSHLKPAPIGAEVVIEAKLKSIEERKLIFDVIAYWGSLKIGEGTHERFIINKAKFINKVKELTKQTSHGL